MRKRREDEVRMRSSEAEKRFRAWVCHQKKEFLDGLDVSITVLRDVRTANPDEISRHFRLTYESVIFILDKLTREVKIKMQASGEKNWSGVVLRYDYDIPALSIRWILLIRIFKRGAKAWATQWKRIRAVDLRLMMSGGIRKEKPI